ncbi:MAG: ABC transporter ATP-binding protein [Parasphingopyxis sp.]|nr:ABC transporter ATP-binding protein [Sphingomonadales bacterium]
MSARLEARGIAIPDRLSLCDLDLAGGELTMLVGPNGAGKTSLLHALAGIGEAEGEVRIDGHALAAAAPARRIELLSYLGESRDVRWPLLASDFVALGLARRDRDRVQKALEAASAARFADRRVDRLSTGERSRVLLARALAPQAGVLLLDEPCANLDPKWQLDTIERLKAEADIGRAVLLSIHDLGLAQRHGNRVIVVDHGRIVADGPPGDALDAPNIERIFGVGRDAAGHWRRT